MANGLGALLAVFRELVDRPRWWRRPDKAIRGDRPLPVICLIKNASGDDHDFARIDADGADEACARRWEPARRGSLPLLPLLDELATQLKVNRFSRNGLRRFRHYGLVDWLSSQSLAPGDDGHRDMFRRLQDWVPAARRSGEPTGLGRVRRCSPPAFLVVDLARGVAPAGARVAVVRVRAGAEVVDAPAFHGARALDGVRRFR
ncbi:hypothetical protein [Allokutzneria sp. NRRL B-24872]|uniref:hypothetical protein n=1 Tax=Allokutzneria sp. NRRL B-24872 TaxID=1137961 RepID=UPI000A36DCA4|nr:hypothetical protein [Allokutzneria sp. NRRL B-24872]